MNIKRSRFDGVHLTSILKNWKSRFITTLVILIVLLLNVGFAYTQDQQPTPTANTDFDRWTAPRALGVGWFQSIVLDREGNLHVVYYAASGQADELEYQQRQSNGTWITPNDIFCPCAKGITVRNDNQ